MQGTAKVNGLKKGDILSETQYYKVQAVRGNLVDVVNERGFPFSVSKDIVEEGMVSASQWATSEHVSRTKIAEMLLGIGDTAFEVSFQKLPDAATITKAITSLNQGKIKTSAEMAVAVKEAYAGETRILKGYKIDSEPQFGRIKVIDLEYDTTKGSNIRLVDLRTVNYLIFRGVKYIASK